MSVIAYDGRTIAADRQGTRQGLRTTAPKLVRRDGGVIGWIGSIDRGMALADLFDTHLRVSAWPEWQRGQDSDSVLVIWTPELGLVHYEREPVAIPCIDPIMAWGSGRDFALGAMARGATAAEAVEIACRFDASCGMGVDVFELGEAAPREAQP